MDKNKLTKEAKTYFEMYPKEDVFHATSDGNFFKGSNLSLAKSHKQTQAKRNKKLDIHTFKRAEFTETKKATSEKSAAAKPATKTTEDKK